MSDVCERLRIAMVHLNQHRRFDNKVNHLYDYADYVTTSLKKPAIETRKNFYNIF